MIYILIIGVIIFIAVKMSTISTPASPTNLITSIHIVADFLRYAPHNQFYANIRKLFSPHKIYENKNYSLHVAYTYIDSGDIFMCIKKNNKIYGAPILVYVLLHEITHLGVQSPEHDDAFWDAFEIVLKDFELYKPNFAVRPREYCGI